MSEDQLNDKQRRFVDEYLTDLDRVRAYKLVYQVDNYNVAAASATRLLKNANVQTYIKECQEEVMMQLGIDRYWVAKRFKDISDRCMQAEPVLDSNGEPTGEYRFDSSGANKATEALGKHVGFFEKDNNQKTPASVTIFQLPDNGRK